MHRPGQRYREEGRGHYPVVGVEANREAAATLAIADPEEADSNAMFGSIKLYRELIEKYKDEDFQVATIAGAQSGALKPIEK